MRNFWSQMPMMRIVFAFIAGVSSEIGADYLHRSKEILWVMLLLICISSIVTITSFFIKDVTKIYRLRVFNGLALSIVVISFSYILTWFYADKNYSSYFQNYLTNESFIVAKIIKPPLQKEKIVTVVAHVEEVINKSAPTKVTGNILINVLRDSSHAELQYGDVIVFNSKVDEFDEPKNPEEFSFKLYQSFHNIYHRTFLTAGNWKLLERNRGNIFMAMVYKIRSYLLSVITKYVKGKNDFAVASAIMLGYHDYMNGDVSRAYASSGALHVLSVSGLHVGVMFIILNFLLQWMDRYGRKYQIAKAIIIILLIWFYACLTGLSPSVMRSAMMFSMIQFGKVMVRNTNTYNIIFGSALLLMLFNPFIITEIGFRLSYLAVLGIVYLHPKIYSRFVFKNWFLDKSWMITAVSISAQIATFPIGVYYFHQFPNLFLISNLVVIPASNFILAFGVSLFVVAKIPYLNDAVGWCFDMLLVGLNKFIFFIDSLSFSLIQGISITMYELVLIYILILLFCWLTEEQKPKVLIASLVIVFSLCSFYSYQRVIKLSQKKMVVYCTPKQSAIAFIDGRNVTTDFDEKLLNDQSSMLFHIMHHWWDCGVKEEKRVSAYKQLPFGKLILFEGKSVLIVDSALEKVDFNMEKKLRIDLLVLSHSPKIYLENLKKMLDFDEVVFDSSNSKWRIDYWRKDCEKLKIRYWDVNEKGAYIQDWR